MEGKKKVFCLGLIILAAAFFFRFYKIDQTAPFLGDQGRDLLEIKAAIDTGQIPLVGPVSNFGIHAGPLYYYLAIPPLLIADFQPLGPIVFFTFLGVISSLLVFLIAQNLFGLLPAFFAALLYACSPAVVWQNLGFWNPIPIPFFGLLIIYALYQIKEQKKPAWLLPLGVFAGIVIQFYPPAFLILAVVMVWLLWERPKSPRWLLVGLALFFLSFLPLLIFQLQNNFTDLKNLLLMVLEKFLLTSAGAESRSLINSFTTVFANQFQPLTG
ncbi:MAG: glycosyltransferase family 39 protein, partial [bacterium]|nr:glycosyltransferase family 39 protein [bacterium]